jgi:hypothetical protein
MTWSSPTQSHCLLLIDSSPFSPSANRKLPFVNKLTMSMFPCPRPCFHILVHVHVHVYGFVLVHVHVYFHVHLYFHVNRLQTENGKRQLSLSAANGNRNRMFVFLNKQMIKGKRRLLCQKTCPSIRVLFHLTRTVSSSTLSRTSGSPPTPR